MSGLLYYANIPDNFFHFLKRNLLSEFRHMSAENRTPFDIEAVIYDKIIMTMFSFSFCNMYTVIMRKIDS